jgi:quinol monooxygenase YgiN
MTEGRGFGVYAKLTAHPGRREELVAELVTAARAGRDLGALACSVNRVEGEPDSVWVSETWPDRSTHDAIAHGPALAEVSGRVRALLATLPVHAYGEVAALVVAEGRRARPDAAG